MIKIILKFLLINAFLYSSSGETNCDGSNWKCADGQCIQSKLLCDGEINCLDGSDEMLHLCSAEERSIIEEPKTKCRDGTCENGECMKGRVTCDGKRDCSDGSDETAKLCSSKYCPPLAFRCSYGACIAAKSQCDGIIDCIDNSDESSDLCGGQTHTIITSYDNSTITLRLNIIHSMPVPDGCKFHNIPNLQATYLNNKSLIIQPGQYVEEYASISYNCKPNHLLQGPTYNVCAEGGKWSRRHPTCLKYCPNHILSGNTIESICELNGTTVSCEQPILPGTKVTIACRFGYKKPENQNVNDIILCDEFGEWDNIPFSCTQMCGELNSSINPSINEEKVINSNILVPWHVNIYSNRNNPNEPICFGTIISPKLVISIAHCFWDETKNELFSQNIFKVAAGKLYSDFNATEPLTVQFSDIYEIHISDGYKGPQSKYEKNIALIVLSNLLRYTFYIKPACLEFRSTSELVIKSVKTGRIAGLTNGTSSLDKSTGPEIRSIELKTLTSEDCIEKISSAFIESIEHFDFCIEGNRNDENSIWSVENGSGFLLPKIENGIKRYYLEGVVSNEINGTGKLNDDFLVTLSNIQFYKAMLNFYIEFNMVK